MNRTCTSIAIAVVEYDDRFLIGPRGAELALGGLWEFPGGKVETDETTEAAAVRECLEETGIDVQVVGALAEHDHEYEHDHVRLHFFDCRPLRSDETPRKPFRWVARKRLSDFEFPAGNASVLELLIR